jgi:LysM repeat protein
LIKAINDYDLAQYTLIAIDQKKKGIDFIITPTTVQQRDTLVTVAPAVQPAPVVQPASIQATDTLVKAAPVLQPAPSKEVPPATVSLLENTKVTINHTKAVLATKGSSLLAIANQQKINLSKLFEYNELAEMNILDQDRILFLEKKQKYGGSEIHTTIGSETLYSIAQKEGVQLSSLLALNPSTGKDSVLPAGQKIKLRLQAAQKPSSKKSKKGKKK